MLRRASGGMPPEVSAGSSARAGAQLEVHRYSQVSVTGRSPRMTRSRSSIEIGIARIDLEAGAQPVHGARSTPARRCEILPGGGAQVEPQAVDLLARADDVENENAALAVEARAGAGGDDLAQALGQRRLRAAR